MRPLINCALWKALASGQVVVQDGFEVAKEAARNLPAGASDAVLAERDEASSSSGADGSEASYNFLVVGDWGGHYGAVSSSLRALSAAMSRVAEASSAKFVMSVGDNFYEEGVQSVHDPLFDNIWQNVFAQKPLQIPWFIVAGNHDHRGSVQAQIDFSHVDPSGRWTFPAQFHSQVRMLPFKVDGHQGKLEVVFVDTMEMAGVVDDPDVCTSGHADFGNRADGFVCDSEFEGVTNHEKANAQLEWLRGTLGRSDADFIVVAGHYPIFSIGSHGSTPHLFDKGGFKEVLDAHDVTAYVCGHEHQLSHIRDESTGLNHFVTGLGERCKDDTRHASSLAALNATLVSSETNCGTYHDGFLGISITPEGLFVNTYVNRGESVGKRVGPLKARNRALRKVAKSDSGTAPLESKGWFSPISAVGIF